MVLDYGTTYFTDYITALDVVMIMKSVVNMDVSITGWRGWTRLVNFV